MSTDAVGSRYLTFTENCVDLRQLEVLEVKTVVISTDVFAAIWQARKTGEQSEDAILRRLLKLPAAPELSTQRRGGFYDDRSGVHFPEGLTIHRTYKGRRIEARAHLDRWFIEDTGRSFHSLNKLSQSVNGGKHENAWVNWKYFDKETGKEQFIDHLRTAKERK